MWGGTTGKVKVWHTLCLDCRSLDTSVEMLPLQKSREPPRAAVLGLQRVLPASKEGSWSACVIPGPASAPVRAELSLLPALPPAPVQEAGC